MAMFGRAVGRLNSWGRLSPTADSFSPDAPTVNHAPNAPTPPDPQALSIPPQVNLPHVDTQLNMHQIDGFFEDGSPVSDANNGRWLRPQSRSSTANASCLDAQPPSQPENLSDSTGSKPAQSHDTPEQTEWSAVGHAATGKSGRVIHNLQEEIARLTRDCGVYRSRAEETQRSNETLKIQYSNAQERLRNLEQVNETNLNSIARKDRKIEELRAEMQSERARRQEAEKVANITNNTMQEQLKAHHREQAHTQEVAKHYETQYEVLASTTQRDKTEFTNKIKAVWEELQSMQAAQKGQSVQTERLEVLADQKNREIAALKESNEKLLATHAEYKKIKDNELRDTIERTNQNNILIEKSIDSMKQTEAQMRWAIKLNENNPKSDQHHSAS